jgi:hypothetical protein
MPLQRRRRTISDERDEETLWTGIIVMIAVFAGRVVRNASPLEAVLERQASRVELGGKIPLG